ncbi:MAG: nucleotidyltransferase domain-containing protein [Ignavibacteriaceae bacterium]|nr:nucleotidyltransferase domain-containing protein [Ignavibacteriaceae bacterium]
MRIYNTLDEIFSTYSHVAIIRQLQHSMNGFTGREVAKRANISAPTSLNSLTKLESMNIVKRIIGGRDHIFSLNKENYFVKELLLKMFQIERHFIKDIVEELKNNLSDYVFSAILFGSVARKEETITSDFDICFIFRGNKNKVEIENRTNEIRDSLYTKYGIRIAPLYVSTASFKKKSSPIIKNIIKEGEVLFGKSIQEILNDKQKPKKENRKKSI